MAQIYKRKGREILVNTETSGISEAHSFSRRSGASPGAPFHLPQSTVPGASGRFARATLIRLAPFLPAPPYASRLATRHSEGGSND